MVCDHQWDPLVMASPCPWSESIFSSPLPLCYQRGLYLQPGRLPPPASVLPKDRMPAVGGKMFVYVSVTI